MSREVEGHLTAFVKDLFFFNILACFGFFVLYVYVVLIKNIVLNFNSDRIYELFVHYVYVLLIKNIALNFNSDRIHGVSCVISKSSRLVLEP